MTKNKAHTALAEATYTAYHKGDEVTVHAEHIAYEFYRVRRYFNGNIVADTNGSYSEMDFFMRLMSEFYDEHMPLPHYIARDAFDDVETNDDGGAWSRLCRKCACNLDVPNELLDDAGEGVCGAKGCEEQAEYYVDFKNEEAQS